MFEQILIATIVVITVKRLLNLYTRPRTHDVHTQTEFLDIYPDFLDSLSNIELDNMSISDMSSNEELEILPDYIQ
jgi:hypothetical protein